MEKLLWRVPDALVAVGNSQKRAIEETFNIPSTRVRTIWNGIDVSSTSLNSVVESVRQEGKVVIGSISTLIPQKAVDDLLEVAFMVKKSRNDFKIIIAGDGVLRSELQEKSKDLGLEDIVIWLGWTENASSTVLPGVDIFIQTSRWEGMSIVILEAMAAGKAIIATDVGDNSSVLENGKTGFIVKPGDTSKAAKLLEQLIKDERKRQELGMDAQKRYQKLFTAKVMAEQYDKLYSEVCGEI
jgi:glycosyltransferase involved in cell wall biosynthesis